MRNSRFLVLKINGLLSSELFSLLLSGFLALSAFWHSLASFFTLRSSFSFSMTDNAHDFNCEPRNLRKKYMLPQLQSLSHHPSFVLSNYQSSKSRCQTPLQPSPQPSNTYHQQHIISITAPETPYLIYFNNPCWQYLLPLNASGSSQIISQSALTARCLSCYKHFSQDGCCSDHAWAKLK